MPGLFVGVEIPAEEIDGSVQDLHDALNGGTLKGVLHIDGMAFTVNLVRISQKGL